MAELQRLIRVLNRHIEDDELPEVEKTCQQILELAPGDEDTIQCTITCHILQSQFEEALKKIGDQKQFQFEKAYCLYRIFEETKGLAVLDAIPHSNKTKAILHLEAQLVRVFFLCL